MFVYLLVNNGSRLSYRGFTVNVERRLRQHRREIVGGAKYTAKFDFCNLLCFVGGFETKREALSFEWYTKKNRTSKLTQRVLLCQDTRQRHVSRFCHTLLHPKFINQRIRLELYCSIEDHDFLQTLEDYYGVRVKHFVEHKEKS